jgi:16S rRNA processing protein RimM
VSVEVRTDTPGIRFAAGSVLGTDPAERGPLTVTSFRPHTGHALVRFEEISNRNQADSLRGVWLTIGPNDVSPPDGDNEFHDHQLIGLAVVTVGGEAVGTVTAVLHHGQDLLVIEPAPDSGRRGEVLVPFVAAIAVRVDLPAGRLVIDPPPGLLELAAGGSGEPGRSGGTGGRERAS